MNREETTIEITMNISVHRETMISFAQQWLKTREDAEDAVSTAFLRVSNNGHKYAGQYSYESQAWYRLRHERSTKWKEYARQPVIVSLEEVEELPDTNLSSSSDIARKTLMSLYRHLPTSTLSKRQRDILVLTSAGQSYAQIANRLGITVSIVKHQKTQAINNIQDYLGETPMSSDSRDSVCGIVLRMVPLS